MPKASKATKASKTSKTSKVSSKVRSSRKAAVAKTPSRTGVKATAAVKKASAA